MSAFSYIVKNKGIRTALPFAALTLSPDAQAADETGLVVDAEVDACEFPKEVPFGTQEASAASQSLRIATRADQWTSKHEREFVMLAKKEALGKASAEECARLEQLESERNRLKSPVKFEELVWQAKHEEAVQNLIQAMQKYLEFSSRRAWQSAQKRH